jgi:two-component system chemotaxis response regulator CheB
MDRELDMTEINESTLENLERPGKPSPFACPDCGGVLWELNDGNLVHFRCRTGHAYSAETLLAEQMDGLEDALWVALRALEESASLARRLAERAQSRGHQFGYERFREQEEGALARADLIRQVLQRGLSTPKVSSDTSGV